VDFNKKIALMGLDNAGKTSILTAMKKKFDVPEHLKGLKPTLKVERTSFRFMGHSISNWDFGGQQQYREEYLKHKDRYLGAIDILFYIIDIQDSLRFNDSIKYLTEILQYFKENEMHIPIVVVFHKVDPKIHTDPTIMQNINDIEEKTKEWRGNFELRYMKSNIFEIYTIIQVFSRGISMLYSQNEVIQRFLFDIVEKMENVMALMVFEQNGIELGSYFLENITLGMRKKILTLYEIAQRRIIEDNMNSYEFSDRLDAFTKVSGVIQSFDIEGLSFFILIVLEEHSEEVLIDQLNFFERSYTEMYEILRAILLDDPDKIEKLNP
jgi:small GTP-binding protein